VGVLLTVVAVVLFILAAIATPFAGVSELDVIAWGLAAYALGRIVP
jgi:hypothetical protein